MNVEIRYFTRTGNTKKLADAMAAKLGIKALSTEHPLEGDADILFLGASVYAAGVDPEIKRFISDLDVKVGKVVCFSTAAIIRSAFKQMKKLVEGAGLCMAEEEFHCRGSFKALHKGRPDASDTAGAAEFAAAVIKRDL